jgi:hypothetical protein
MDSPGAIMGGMALAVTRAKRRRDRDWRGRLLALLVLLAFTLQSFITQTHTHDPDQASPAAIVKLLPQPAGGKVPTGNNPANCPFCQAISHAGAFFAPATFLFLPLSCVVHAAPDFIARFAATVARHSWRSRAPPQG